jgi:hypothetical protein
VTGDEDTAGGHLGVDAPAVVGEGVREAVSNTRLPAPQEAGVTVGKVEHGELAGQ